jgi:hypothetical protein
MIIDIAEQIGAISRKVEQQQTERGELVTVTLQRSFPAEATDVWQAITDPERLRSSLWARGLSLLAFLRTRPQMNRESG